VDTYKLTDDNSGNLKTICFLKIQIKERSCLMSTPYDRTFYRDQMIEQYLSEIRETSLLTDQEVAELIKRMRAGDQTAQWKLIEGNLRLVVSIAKRFAHNHLMFLDLIQEGNIGLMKSLWKFDPDRGFKFSTFSSFWIKQEIIRSIENKGRNIRIPVNVMKTIQKIKKLLKKEAYLNSYDDIDIDKISVQVNIKQEKVKDLIKYFEDSVSLEQLMEKNIFALTFSEQFASEPEEIVIKHMMKDQLHCLLDSLTEREKQVIVLRYGLKDQVYRTHQQVAEALNISRERVRQLESRSLDKLRNYNGIEDFRELISA
jgi:RNA polymerase primary sigma factor